MDMQNVGGTPGGMKTFLLGLIMIVVGGYLLMNQVTVHGGFWHLSFLGGYGRSFGITLTARLGETENVDLPETIMRLQMQQVGYEAALAATAKAISPTLLDYLR